MANQGEPQKDAVLGGLRAQLGAALDNVTAEKVEEVVAGIFDLTKSTWAHCPNCHKKVKADFPDVLGQAKALALLADQALGKPVEEQRVTIRVAADWENDLDKMSTDDLRAIADGRATLEEVRALPSG